MTQTVTHTFETVDGAPVTLTFKNTLLGAIRHDVMRDRFTSDDMADKESRRVFIYVAAWVVDVQGSEWRPPSDVSTDQEFIERYHEMTAMVKTLNALYELAEVVSVLREVRKDPETMPDSALPDEELADPN